MNDHRHDVSDLVDMMTDRRLGLFLLSMHRGDSDDQTTQARELLERHEQWANKSRMAYENSEAHLSLALLELVEQSNEKPPRLEEARNHIDRVIECASDARQRQNAFLLKGLLHAIFHVDKKGVIYADPVVVKVFRQADIDDILSSSSDEEVLFAGWRTLLIRLLRWCPYIEKRIGLDGRLQEPDLGDETSWARHQFFSTLVKDEELQSALTNWAEGSEDASPLEQIFYIAVHLQEPRSSQDDTGWQSMAHECGRLAEAYRLSLKARQNLVRQAGLPLVQDLHLLDAKITSIDNKRNDEQMLESEGDVSLHLNFHGGGLRRQNRDLENS